MCSDTLTKEEFHKIVEQTDTLNQLIGKPDKVKFEEDDWIVAQIGMAKELPCFVLLCQPTARGQGKFKVLTCSDCK